MVCVLWLFLVWCVFVWRLRWRDWIRLLRILGWSGGLLVV